MDNLKILSLFSGIGAFEKAISRLNIPYDIISYCEIDKYASKAYSLMHDVSENFNLGDITKVEIDKLQDFDLMTWGFPCQDISVAGKQQGIKEGTRSGLYYEGLRILKAKRPNISIIENVKNLVGKKFKTEFEQILKDLEELGYKNYWKVLNAKDYGIPQNRERVFIVSILDNREFKFPKPFDNGLRLKDLLENEVDKKYYLSQEVQNRFRITNQTQNIIGTTKPPYRTIGQRDLVYDPNGVMGALVATDYKQPKQILQVGELDIKGQDNIRRVYSSEGVSPTLTNMQGGNRQSKIMDDTAKLLFIGGIGEKDWADDGKKYSRNYPQGDRIYDSDGIACSQTAQGGGIGSYTGLYKTDYRIRKLTPLECFRLMGFDDQDYYILKQNNISDTQLYKMAGNSIVVNVLEHILKNLYKSKEVY